MSTQQEGDQTAVNREDSELSAQEEDTAGETGRRHVDALLDISEDNFRKEQEPFEDHDYSGWEEAVTGWSRAAPSCILQIHSKLKHKEADHPTLLSTDQTPSKADISTSTSELHRKSHVDLADCNKSVSPNKQINSLDPTELCSTSRGTTEFLFKEKAERPFGDKHVWPYHFSSQYTVHENRHTMPQKPSHKPINKLVPIKNIVFPPPMPPQIIPKVSCNFCRCRQTQNNKNHGENMFMLDNRRGQRGTGVDSLLTSKSHSWQHNPQMFSTLNVSNPTRNQLHPEAVHPTRYSQAVVQPHMPPRYLLS
uniref:Uncharacterized protein n=1 Tax=Nothobranchius kadleci TaxID=1051664 RepID=A0A1A8D175_NOTKA